MPIGLQLARSLAILAVTLPAWLFGGITATGQLATAGLIAAAWVLTLIAGARQDDRPAFGRAETSPVRLTAPAAAIAFVAFGTLIAAQLLIWRPLGLRLESAVFGDLLAAAAADERTRITLDVDGTLSSAAWIGLAAAAVTLGSVLFPTPGLRRSLYAAILANAVALAAFGIVQKLTWNGGLFWSVPLRFGGQPFASFVNRNNAAAYLSLGYVCGFALLLRRRRASESDRTEAPPAAAVATKPAVRRTALPPGARRLAAWQPDRRSEPTSAARRFARRPNRRERTPRHERPTAATATAMADATLEEPPADPPGGPSATETGLVAVALGGIVLGVLASGSRSGLLGLVVATIAGLPLLAAWRERRTIAVAAAGSVAAVAGSLGLAAAGVAGSGLTRLDRLRDLVIPPDGRFAHWRDTLAGIADQPLLGMGLGSYRETHRPYQDHVAPALYANADGEFIEWALEAGLAGAACWLLLAATVAIALPRRCRDPERRDAALVAVMLVFGQAAHAAFDFGLSLPAALMAASVLLGLLWTPSRRGPDDLVARLPTLPDRPPGGVTMLARGAWWLVATIAVGSACFHLWTGLEKASLEESAPDLSFAIAETITASDDCAAEAASLIRRRPYDAEVRLLAARLAVFRMRVAIAQAAAPGFPNVKGDFDRIGGLDDLRDADDLWRRTDPAPLWAAVAQARHAAAAAGGDESAIGYEGLLPTEANLFRLEAVAHLQAASELAPLLPPTQRLLACLEAEPGRVSHRLRREAAVSPASPDRLTALGTLAHRVGDTELALRLWRRALELAPDEARPPLAAALRTADPAGQMLRPDDVLALATETGRLPPLLAVASLSPPLRDDALAAAERLAAQSPQLSQDDRIRGQIALLRGETDRGVALLRRAAKAAPLDIQTRLALLDALIATDRIDEATGEGEAIGTLFPDHPGLLRRLGRLRRASPAPGVDPDR